MRTHGTNLLLGVEASERGPGGFLVYGALLLVGLGARAAAQRVLGWFPATWDVALYDASVFNLLAWAFTLAPFLFVLAILAPHRWKDYLPFRSVAPGTLLLWLGVLQLLLLGFEASALLFSVADPAVVTPTPSTYRWLTAFSLLVVAPLTEETLFRGVAYKVLEDAGYRRLAIVVPAVSWAVIHVQYEAFTVAQLAFAGVVMGIARQRTGSLWPTIVMHVAWSAVCVLSLFP